MTEKTIVRGRVREKTDPVEFIVWADGEVDISARPRFGGPSISVLGSNEWERVIRAIADIREQYATDAGSA